MLIPDLCSIKLLIFKEIFVLQHHLHRWSQMKELPFITQSEAVTVRVTTGFLSACEPGNSQNQVTFLSNGPHEQKQVSPEDDRWRRRIKLKRTSINTISSCVSAFQCVLCTSEALWSEVSFPKELLEDGFVARPWQAGVAPQSRLLVDVSLPPS